MPQQEAEKTTEIINFLEEIEKNAKAKRIRLSDVENYLSNLGLDVQVGIDNQGMVVFYTGFKYSPNIKNEYTEDEEYYLIPMTDEDFENNEI